MELDPDEVFADDEDDLENAFFQVCALFHFHFLFLVLICGFYIHIYLWSCY